MATSLLLHPSSLSGILDSTFSLYRRSFIALVLVSALSQIPVGLLQGWSQPTLNANLGVLASLGNRPSASLASLMHAVQSLLVLGLFFFASVLAADITQAALTQAMLHIFNNDRLPVARAYALGFPRYLSIITTSVIGYILRVAMVICGASGYALLAVVATPVLSLLARLLFVGAGILLLGLALGSLYCHIKLLLWLPTIVIERVGPFTSITRSWRLTRKTFWRALGFQCAVSFCYYVCLIAPANLTSYFSQQQTLVLLVRYTCLIFAAPIVSLAYSLFYYDLRMRNEGYDLEVRIQQIEAGE